MIALLRRWWRPSDDVQGVYHALRFFTQQVLVMNHQPCSVPGCVAMAERDGKCAAHASGYQQHSGAHELRCYHCHRKIERGEWFRRDPNECQLPRHVRPCKARLTVVATATTH